MTTWYSPVPMNAEGAEEILPQVEVLRHGELLAGLHLPENAAEHEGADGPAVAIVPEEIPLPLDRGEVEGLHGPHLRTVRIQLPVGETDRPAAVEGFGHRREGLEVGHRAARGHEGDRPAQLVEGDAELAPQRFRQLAKGRTQGLLEGRSLVRAERPTGHEEREYLPLGHLHGGQGGYLPVVEVTVLLRIPLDGEAPAVPHEGDVPLHGLWGHLQLARHARTVQRLLRRQPLMDSLHPLKGRPGLRRTRHDPKNGRTGSGGQPSGAERVHSRTQSAYSGRTDSARTATHWGTS